MNWYDWLRQNGMGIETRPQREPYHKPGTEPVGFPGEPTPPNKNITVDPEWEKWLKDMTRTDNNLLQGQSPYPGSWIPQYIPQGVKDIGQYLGRNINEANQSAMQATNRAVGSLGDTFSDVARHAADENRIAAGGRTTNPRIAAIDEDPRKKMKGGLKKLQRHLQATKQNKMEAYRQGGPTRPGMNTPQARSQATQQLRAKGLTGPDPLVAEAQAMKNKGPAPGDFTWGRALRALYAGMFPDKDLPPDRDKVRGVLDEAGIKGKTKDYIASEATRGNIKPLEQALTRAKAGNNPYLGKLDQKGNVLLNKDSAMAPDGSVVKANFDPPAKDPSGRQTANKYSQVMNNIRAAEATLDNLQEQFTDGVPDLLQTGSALGEYVLPWINPSALAPSLKAKIKQLNSDEILNNLKALKEQSKRGDSGLGQVTEKELDILASRVRNLTTIQDPEVLYQELELVRARQQYIIAMDQAFPPGEVSYEQLNAVGLGSFEQFMQNHYKTYQGGGGNKALLNSARNRDDGWGAHEEVQQ